MKNNNDPSKVQEKTIEQIEQEFPIQGAVCTHCKTPIDELLDDFRRRRITTAKRFFQILETASEQPNSQENSFVVSPAELNNLKLYQQGQKFCIQEIRCNYCGRDKKYKMNERTGEFKDLEFRKQPEPAPLLIAREVPTVQKAPEPKKVPASVKQPEREERPGADVFFVLRYPHGDNNYITVK